MMNQVASGESGGVEDDVGGGGEDCGDDGGGGGGVDVGMDVNDCRKWYGDADGH